MSIRRTCATAANAKCNALTAGRPIGQTDVRLLQPPGLATINANNPQLTYAFRVLRPELIKNRRESDLLSVSGPRWVEPDLGESSDRFAIASITNKPPPSRVDRNAIRSPSGENAG